MPLTLQFLSESRRRAVYAALAEAVAGGLAAPVARARVGVRFHLSIDAVATVEQAGRAAGRPLPARREPEGRLTRDGGTRPPRRGARCPTPGSARMRGGAAVCFGLVIAAAGLTSLAGGCRSAPDPGPSARLAPAPPATAGAAAAGGPGAPAPDWVK
jgi:hypothetical protein